MATNPTVFRDRRIPADAILGADRRYHITRPVPRGNTPTSRYLPNDRYGLSPLALVPLEQIVAILQEHGRAIIPYPLTCRSIKRHPDTPLDYPLPLLPGQEFAGNGYLPLRDEDALLPIAGYTIVGKRDNRLDIIAVKAIDYTRWPVHRCVGRAGMLRTHHEGGGAALWVIGEERTSRTICGEVAALYKAARK